MTYYDIFLVTLMESFWMYTFHLDCFAGRICRRHGDFGWPRRGVDIARVLEEDVRLDVNEVGRVIPHVLSVVDDANHVVAAREQRSGMGKVECDMLKCHVASWSTCQSNWLQLVSKFVNVVKISCCYIMQSQSLSSKEYKAGPSSQLLRDFPTRLCSGCWWYHVWWL